MKNILIVTSSRSEYGLLANLIKGISESKKLNLHIVVTGSHLSFKHGKTLSELLENDVHIDKKFFLDYTLDTNLVISKNISKIVNQLTRFFTNKKIDLMLVLGDRYEIFAATIAALFSKVKIAHLHGGERSEGSIDDLLRHSITKMSNLHFVATNEYRKRVIQLGENPQSVFKVGALCNDNINNLKIINKTTLEKKLGFKFKEKNILISIHPETKNIKAMNRKLENFFSAIKSFKDTGMIFTHPSSDEGNFMIIRKIQKFISKNSNSKSFKSLGFKKYLSCLSYCSGLVGNSSSGIIEAPLMKKGSINVGSRQFGRQLSKSVINCEFTKKDIKNSLIKLFSKQFKKKLLKVKSPYYGINVADKIVRVLENVNLSKVGNKKFYDLK